MRYLKGKSNLSIFQKFENMKFAYWNREFWCKDTMQIRGQKYCGHKELHKNHEKLKGKVTN